MADGIDRKADERMEFTTSKDVVVNPTFQDMNLKGKCNAPALGTRLTICREPSSWYLRLWIRISLRCSVPSDRANLQGSRHHRPGAIRYW